MMAKAMEKQQLMHDLNETGSTSITYRLMLDNRPQYVTLFAIRPAEDSQHVIIAVSNIDVAKQREMEFRAALDDIFASDLASGASVSGDSRGRRFLPANILCPEYDSYWALPDGQTNGTLTISLPEPRTFNRILLQEYIPLGQRIAAFHIDILTPEGDWRQIARETTVGYKRIVLTPTVTATTIRMVIDSALAPPTLTRLALYDDTIYCDH